MQITFTTLYKMSCIISRPYQIKPFWAEHLYAYKMCEGKITACVVINVSSIIADDYLVDSLYTLSGVWNVELRVAGDLGILSHLR